MASDVARRRTRVDENLLSFLDPARCGIPARLRDAMQYSLTAGGKRIRPVILLSAGAAVGGDEADMLPFACAVEYVHTYSLIHDDLPAMDDDDFRRGRPTCHKRFGEAAAILAGDALLTEAFRVMGESPLAVRQPARAVRAMALLARAAGAEGMVGGQDLDLAAPPGEGVEGIHRRKTAALIEASAGVGAILGGGSADHVAALRRYGAAVGLLFQITDDILDETGSFEEMGKAVAKDRERGKLTYPGQFGMAAAAARSEALGLEARAALAPFGEEAESLREIIRMVAARRS